MPASSSPPRLLLVSSYFGVRNHTGGFRWRAIVPGLVALGWDVDVVTMGSVTLDGFEDAAPAPFGPHVRVAPVPEMWWGLRALRTAGSIAGRITGGNTAEAPASSSDDSASPPAGRLAKVAQTARAQVDAAFRLAHDDRWAERALRVARRLADDLPADEPYRAVVVTSPSHAAHRVGVGLHRSHGVPYVADFRDPWYYGREEDLAALDPLTRRAWKRRETRALPLMDAIVDISDGARRAVLADPAYPGGPERTFIRSGYVPREAVARPSTDHFRVVYTGWLYPFSDLDALFAACARLRERHKMGDRLRIEFMGTAQEVGGRPLSSIAAAHGLADAFRWHPRRPQTEAEALQESAAVSVAYDSVVSRALCIPSKLYHYAQAYGDLLLIGDPDGAMAQEAAEIGQRVYAPTDAAGLDAALDAAYARWTARDYPAPLDADGVFNTFRSAQAWHDVLTRLDSAPDAR